MADKCQEGWGGGGRGKMPARLELTETLEQMRPQVRENKQSNSYPCVLSKGKANRKYITKWLKAEKENNGEKSMTKIAFLTPLNDSRKHPTAKTCQMSD